MANSSSEGARALHLEKERASILSQIQRQKDQISKDKAIKVGSDKFVAQNDWVDSELKRQTVGLVRLEDFQRIRSTLEEKKRQDDQDTSSSKRDVHERGKKTKKRANIKSALSFDFDEAGDDPDAIDADAGVNAQLPKKPKKNPGVDTSFLPDKEREAREQLERSKLEKEWHGQQEAIKSDRIMVTYSFWDGSGHRKQVECRKGDSIRQFLEKCRVQWPQLRSVNVDNLIYVKEDLLIPSHYSFYDFIINKSRGKSGPLFAFDARDDVRLINDARIETEDSHAGKVMERSWYENNKHIFPASRWEVFDPHKDYGKYTIKDTNKEA
ncbi:hypothetical protein BASA50_003648 [Batrachochytrium salamandrivorans]|uniref:FAM50A/XAP5 C-terminal domain-containing protein n=1 Tax=Batrachochytrium salamandrivorans TaxID=1357716 RepID=A0ABQ8FI93_9FUNG|nr:hypothetical protein BASA60_008099 [Batrachochytrium salamandrivorans]KAH6598610.1 hypothetical protein BASA50_003648 [Batrachochytrium salamandrivorans]KAH6600787.1 hypothetical protein BASA61_002205 [Batrachochytrium salamandrivorans]KAH9276307.1 hypothetical protein BASA83_000989 [Batrachochytrium salamandrivorans]